MSPSVSSRLGSFNEVDRRNSGGGCGDRMSGDPAQYCRWYSVLRAENGIYGSDLLYREKLLLVCCGSVVVDEALAELCAYIVVLER